MAKYIKSYDASLTESLGVGSIVLIKGKNEAGRRKLYATHVVGYTELRPGAVMLFLSDDFYRIVREGDVLKPVRIAFRSEESLRSELRIKSPGTISVVRNNSKTPFHWKTLKHINLISALREVTPDILADNYIVESVEDEENSRLFTEFWEMAVIDTLSAIFFEESGIEIIDYRISEGLEDAVSNSFENEQVNSPAEWDTDFTVFFKSAKYTPYLKHFNLDRTDQVTIFFKTDFHLEFKHYPGSYYTPPDVDADFELLGTEIQDILLAGSSPNELTPAIVELLKKIEPIVQGLTDDKFKDLLEKNIKSSLYSEFLRK